MPQFKPKDTWFIKERSEAIACLMLTKRKGIRVRNEREREAGVDLLVEIGEEDSLSTIHFLVLVRGTVSFEEKLWKPSVKPLFATNPKVLSLPTCVFVINVRENRALYSWLAEPSVEDHLARLRFASKGTFEELEQEIVETILDRVEQWYDALNQQLTSRTSG